jgi:hypothetical protein
MVPKFKPRKEHDPVDVDLFIKKMPRVVKDLITREALENRRSLNQEAIALLEEALLSRVSSTAGKRRQIEAVLASYADSGPGALSPLHVDPDNAVAPTRVQDGPSRPQ